MGIAYLDALLFGYREIQDDGAPLARRSALDISGAGVTVEDDEDAQVTRLVIGGFGTSYRRVLDAGNALPQREDLNVLGFAVADDSGGAKTDLALLKERPLGGILSPYWAATIPGLVAPRWVVAGSWTLLYVIAFRETAGASGSTKVDLRKNGTTMFVDDAARPAIASGSGNEAAVVKGPAGVFVTNEIDDGDTVALVLLEAETYLEGPPEGPAGLSVAVVLQARTPP